MNGLGNVGGNRAIGSVQGGAQGMEASAVRPAPAQAHRPLAAAAMHRSEALQAFKQALMDFNRDGVSQWVGSAYRDEATAAKAREALDVALSSGLDSAERLEGQAVRIGKFAEMQSQGLEKSTRTLLVLSTAYEDFEAGQAIFNDQKASPAQRWDGAQRLIAAHQDLRAQAREADLGTFDPKVQHNLKLLMKSLAGQCDAAVKALEKGVREQSRPEVRSLFEQRDAVDSSIIAANGRLDSAIKAQSPKDRQAVMAEVRSLLKQREQLNERIGNALNPAASGPAARPDQSPIQASQRLQVEEPPQAKQLPRAAQQPQSQQPQVQVQQPQPQPQQPQAQQPARAPQQGQAPPQARPVAPLQAQQPVAAVRAPSVAPTPSKVQALQEGVAALDVHIQTARAKLQGARQAGASPALKAAEATLDRLVKAQLNMKEQAQREQSAPRSASSRAQREGGTGLFARISRHFQQNSVTDSARRGWGDVNFPQGLEARRAVAAHLRGVLERAGVAATDIPRRRDLRAQMQEPPPAPKQPAAQVAAQAAAVQAADDDMADFERRLAVLRGDPPPTAAPAPAPSAQAGVDDMAEIARRLAALMEDPPKAKSDGLDELSAQIKPVVDESRAYLQKKQTENDAVLNKVKAQVEHADRRNALFASLLDIENPENQALLRELDEMGD